MGENFFKVFSSVQLSGCDNVVLVGNGFCNNETNIAACNYDSGECCGPDVSCKWPCFFHKIVWNQTNYMLSKGVLGLLKAIFFT